MTTSSAAVHPVPEPTVHGPGAVRQHGPERPHEPELQPGDPAAPGHRTSWAVLVVALVAQVLVVLDISVVNAALPTIGRSLHLGGGDLQWLVTAYLLASGGGLLLGGRVADLLSRRGVFLAGLTSFTVASLLSGFAESAPQLIAARGAQGLGAALLTPAALSLIMTTYSGAQRHRGLALWGLVGSLGIAAGVLLGGALTTWAGWQMIFWINVPIGLAAGVVALRILPRHRTARSRLADFDFPGALTAVTGLGALMVALGGVESHGWFSARTLGALTLSAVLMTAFVLVERRVASPLVPPHTWRVSRLVSGTTVMLGVTGILVGTVFLTSIHLQTVLGFAALSTGLALLPLAAGIAVGTHLASRALGHASPRTVATAGMVLVAGGAALLAALPEAAEYVTHLLPGLVLVGLGAGMVFVSVSVSAMVGIPPQHAGMASGFLMTGHEIGAALGVAVLSAAASAAGDLTSPAGAVAGISGGFVAAVVGAVLIGLVALLKMPATRAEASGGSLHLH